MGELDLRVEHLVLDNDNPRITHSEGQHQTLQKVIKDQKMKLVRLAESIVERGLSPIERLMVLEVSGKPKRYVALEGNRRVTALKLLTNPAVMTGLDMPPGMQKAFEQLAGVFVRSDVEPIASYEVNSREEGRYWIELRHNGEDEGRGVVSWKPIVAARYRNKEPAVQALEMVLEHGGLSENDVESIQSNFKLTTLRRLIDSTAVRDELGLSVKDGKLHTDLPGAEVIKPLKRMVLDIADKKVDTRTFNKTEQMLTYVKGFGKSDKPDRAKKVAQRAVEGIERKEFTKPPKAKPVRKAASPERKNVVPKPCSLNVTDNRISEIYQELRTLKLENARNAISVLMRVFLELSVDHFLEHNGGTLSIKTGGGEKWKKLDAKLAETVAALVQMGVPSAPTLTDGSRRALS